MLQNIYIWWSKLNYTVILNVQPNKTYLKEIVLHIYICGFAYLISLCGCIIYLLEHVHVLVLWKRKTLESSISIAHGF